jgi:hypothetical protein
MAIKPPAWCAHAVPDKNKGWVDPKSGELYKSSRFTQAEVDAFHGNVTPAAASIVQEATQEDVQDMITEGKIQSAMMDMELEDMSKVELEELGRENGVELDRRKSKKSLVQAMKTVLSK